MTHPAPKYCYLKDRRPALYKELVSEKANFVNTTNKPLGLDTNLLKGGFTYPTYKGGEEIPAKRKKIGKNFSNSFGFL